MVAWQHYGCSVIGPGHIRRKLPNQDCYYGEHGTWGEMIAVCDGMGSCPLSHIGSHSACQAVYETAAVWQDKLYDKLKMGLALVRDNDQPVKGSSNTYDVSSINTELSTQVNSTSAVSIEKPPRLRLNRQVNQAAGNAVTKSNGKTCKVMIHRDRRLHGRKTATHLLADQHSHTFTTQRERKVWTSKASSRAEDEIQGTCKCREASKTDIKFQSKSEANLKSTQTDRGVLYQPNLSETLGLKENGLPADSTLAPTDLQIEVVGLNPLIDWKTLSRDFLQQLYFRWYELIVPHEIKDCNTTCLFAVHWPKLQIVLVGQLGDGMVAIHSQAQTKLLFGDDNKAFANFTYGLGNVLNFNLWRLMWIHDEQLNAVMLTTDGVADDLEHELKPLFVSDILQGSLSMSASEFYADLEQMLINWPTPMHTDDKTIACLINPTSLAAALKQTEL